MIDLDTYDFELPKEFIAQKPIKPRDTAKLMILRKKNKIEHKSFYNIIDEFESGDLILLNNSKVIPSRMFGKKETGGKIEILFIKNMEKKYGENIWLVMLRGRGLKKGRKIIINGRNSSISGEIIKRVERAEFLIKSNLDTKVVRDFIKENGIIALPPYIKKPYNNFQMYQTIYSKKEGSIAAPTAGLHFTKELLDNLKKKGVNIGYLTLHVSASSFKPVYGKINKSPLDPEFFSIPKETEKSYNNSVNDNKNIGLVGTTTLKAIESATDKNGLITKNEGYSDLFIYPGYEFHSKVSKFITNFHTPRSPPLLMVSAYLNWERILESYKIAMEKGYRFYSFGDAMLIDI
ncbi:MAG: tRNA preQ1(34) S-adenosylmethionine ribosyltransferase-isomerase QueA [Promethearchaeota archaeon]|nr:MAG: tRNA preQ1(34) S-adenosylmethionine ribosyltransferase-isomerase QueA [Candidatus Lokiarchaeota archaeon]